MVEPVVVKAGDAPVGMTYRVPEAAEWPRFIAGVEAAFARAAPCHPPVSQEILGQMADAFLASAGWSCDFRAFAMVMFHNTMWRPIVRSVPMVRRTLLLPPCLRDATRCPAEFDEYGLLCEGCGACCIGDLSELAESLGYAVLVAEGTGVVTRLLARGAVDAVIGVSCMASLERTFEQISRYAVPGLALPLLQDGCRDTRVPLELVREAIRLAPLPEDRPPVDLRVLRETVQAWFSEPELRMLIQPHASRVDELSLSWLARDGKRWRPVMVVALYAACARAGSEAIPARVHQVAVAVECIHKGSLIYDDIQDDDQVRYGDETIHRSHGVPMALTCALQLIGLGYRLMAGCGADPAIVQRLLELATTAHVELCVGQGEDVGWLQHPRPLSSAEVLEMFRWKTAPSFVVVFLLGAILAGVSEHDEACIRAYSQEVGVAYQIRDDLTDYTTGGDVDDILMGRPCLMSALAVEHTSGADREALLDAWLKGGSPGAAACIREAIRVHGIEAHARALLASYRERAIQAIVPLTDARAKILLHRLAWHMLA